MKRSLHLRRTEQARTLFVNLATPEVRQLPAPQAPEPVPPYRRALSASSLKTFIECERKWYFRYLCTVIDDPGSAAGTYGTAFHEALEILHQRYPRPQAKNAQEMKKTLDQLLIASFRKHATGLGSPLEAELQTRRARRTGERYIAWILQHATMTPFTVIGNETHAPVEVDGHTFTGFIDRLDRNEADGSISIIDYKTGSIAQSAAEYHEEVAALREFQLPLYYWSRTAQGEHVARLILIPLKDPQRDVTPIELEIIPGRGKPSGRSARGTIGIEELERAKRRMGELALQLTTHTRAEFKVTDDSDSCTYCAYAVACRARPTPCEDPFGR